MIIFVEGTTTNGEGLIAFKKGAFILEGPIKCCSIKYGGTIHPAYIMCDMIPLALAMMTNIGYICTFQESINPIYMNEGVSWEEYATEVRKLMAEQMGFQLFEGDFIFKKSFEELLLRGKNK